MEQVKINYCDNASTTKTDARVIDAMIPFFSDLYGNASSNHFFGKTTKEAIEKAREQVANLINCFEDEILFTSGATESINTVLKGYLEANSEKGNHIVTVKTEHKAVISTCEYLETKGCEVTYLDVNENGIISLEQLESAIKDNTVLISVMYVNNETGVIQPIQEIGEIAKEKDVKFFCDATQAIGKVLVDVADDNIDMLCFSGHKINGPKGVGALYIKEGIELIPLIHGGGQEKKMRGGTYNSPLIVGLGKACEIIRTELDEIRYALDKTSSYVLEKIELNPSIKLIAKNAPRTDSILTIMIKDIDANIFINKFQNIAVSNGSACTSMLLEGSHVLKAMGYTDKECMQCIRLSFDKHSDINNIEVVLEALKSF